MRIRVFLLLLKFWSPSLALKGQRRKGRTRALQNPSPPPKEVYLSGIPKDFETSQSAAPQDLQTYQSVAPKALEADESSPAPKEVESDQICKKADKRKDPTGDDDIPYCLHGDLTRSQCANLHSLPKEKALSSDLQLELIHEDTNDPQAILRNVEEILDTDTNPRFVGCKDMAAPPPLPPPPPGQRTRQLVHKIILQSEQDHITLTGVDFKNVGIVGHGCKKSLVPPGHVCDLVESNVEIYYEGNKKPEDEDEQEMQDLLVETIMAQANAGSFSQVGSLGSVEVYKHGPILTSNGHQYDDKKPIIEGLLGTIVAVLVIGLLMLCSCFFIFIKHYKEDDDSENENIKISENENIKISENENIKISENENIKISENENIKISENENIKISENNDDNGWWSWFGLSMAEETATNPGPTVQEKNFVLF